MNIYIQKISQLAIQNKYTKWYINICQNSLNRYNDRNKAKEDFGYVESHHIVPRCFKIGGEKDQKNIVHLKMREHFICHLLLTKMFESEYNKKMNYAFICFCNLHQHNKRKLSSIQYELYRKACKSRQNSKGRICSEETKKKISIKRKGISNRKNYQHSEETKKKLSEKAKLRPKIIGRICSEETRKKIGQANKNQSEERRKRNSEIQKQFIWIYNPDTLECLKIHNSFPIPENFIRGRILKKKLNT